MRPVSTPACPAGRPHEYGRVRDHRGRRDGIDAAVELFRNHGVRAIFATAHCDDDARRRAQPAFPLAWLRKPYTVDSLVAAVRRAFHQLQGETR
jgi:two-component system, response regulator PdtaR